MSYLSQDGEEGYPGAVLTTIKFKLTPENKLDICMRATTSKPTIVNLSHGSMFNLAGHVSNVFLNIYLVKCAKCNRILENLSYENIKYYSIVIVGHSRITQIQFQQVLYVV